MKQTQNVLPGQTIENRIIISPVPKDLEIMTLKETESSLKQNKDSVSMALGKMQHICKLANSKTIIITILYNNIYYT